MNPPEGDRDKSCARIKKGMTPNHRTTVEERPFRVASGNEMIFASSPEWRLN